MNSRRRSQVTKDTHLSDIHEDVLLPLPDRAALFGGQIEVRLAVVVALRTPPPPSSSESSSPSSSSSFTAFFFDGLAFFALGGLKSSSESSESAAEVFGIAMKLANSNGNDDRDGRRCSSWSFRRRWQNAVDA
jgi:hypothetical protein